jgi:K+-transporting ATPase ATPase A chain
MTLIGVAQIVVYLLLILAVTKPLGLFMMRVFEGDRTFLHPVFRPLEKLLYKLGGVREDVEQRWTRYAASLLSFSLFCFVILYALQRLQAWFPFNPQRFGATTPDLAFNTSVSFLTNTNWQSYTPETTMSYFVQMAGLAVQNFASAAVGLAVAIALIRGFARQTADAIGNFWVDLVRSTVYVLLPIALVAAMFLCSQGAIQNFSSYKEVKTVEGAKQVIPQGPAASQEAIKMLGTNGGGFFNANSAHPYENPTPLANLLQMILIFLIPSGLTYTFGRMVKDTRQGWALWGAMTVLFLAGVFTAYWAEQAGNPNLAALGVESKYTGVQPGGNMEGKDVRFGNAASALFATVTTDASCGAVNAMHDSFTPLGGMVPLFNIETDEVIFGGVGSGLYGMLIYAILAVFIAGLMVGRTPEYIGKKIEQKEVRMAMIAVLATAACILVFTGVGAVAPFVKNGYWNPPGPAIANLGNGGPHGFSEMLYAYSSGTENNGSAFAGINANTPFYNLTIGFAMLLGRFFFIIPTLVLAGSLAGKKKLAVTSGTLPTHGGLFIVLLVGTVLIIGALTFFPALSLGPIVEHFLMHDGKLFSLVLFPLWS